MANDDTHNPVQHQETREQALRRSAEVSDSFDASLAYETPPAPLSGAEAGWLSQSIDGTLPAGGGIARSREALLLRMQGTLSNQAVQRLVEQRLSSGRAVGEATVSRSIQRQTDAPPADAGTGTKTDDEGNGVSSDGGRDHLTKIPEGVDWQSGKPEGLPPNPKAAFAALHGQVQAVADQQRANADGLKGDMKYWFARVYQYVTEEELKAIDAHTYQYPLMKMQEVIAFNATYMQNLEAWKSGNTDKVESNWKAAFESAERSTVRTPGGWVLQVVSLGMVATRSSDIMDALLPSMEAHIRFDLPRAIASCYESNYAGIPDLSLGDFRGDFDKMGPVFDAAQLRLRPEMDQYNSKEFGVDPGNWHWMQAAAFPFVFDVPMEREQAWEKASAIVDGHAQGITDQAEMQQRLQAYMTGAHPFSGSDAFMVGDVLVEDYQWSNQPAPETPLPSGDYEPPKPSAGPGSAYA